MTGGNAFFLSDRTYVGGAQYDRLLSCGSYLDLQTCR
jgi:alpha-1,4-digalacturonate transport system permease protein